MSCTHHYVIHKNSGNIYTTDVETVEQYAQTHRVTARTVKAQ